MSPSVIGVEVKEINLRLSRPFRPRLTPELEAKLGEEHQGTGASGSGSSTDRKVAVKAESAVGYPMEVEEDPPAPASSSGDLPKAGIEVEAKPEKSEILEEEPRRRKVLRFGSAHIKLLRAVADADASNWNSLQKCLREHGGATPGQKTALVERLEELATRRAESRAGALQALEDHQRSAIETSELDTLNYLGSRMGGLGIPTTRGLKWGFE